MRRSARAAVVLMLLAPAVALAEPPRALRYDLRADGIATAAAAAALLAAAVAEDEIAPRNCRVCGTNALDAWARDRLAWRSERRARLPSHVLAYGVLPAAVVTHGLLAARESGDVNTGWVDVLLIAEAATIAANVNNLVKYTVARQRPGRGDTDRAQSDDNLSLPSGHTAFAFALVSSAATVAQLRGYRTARWVWGAGLVLAAAVGYLRVAADEHHLTDVATGAAVGTAFGIAVPRLLHGREERRGGSLAVTPFGIALSF